MASRSSRGIAGLPDHAPEGPERASNGGFRIPPDLLAYVRALSFAIAAQVVREGGPSYTPGVGQTLRLLAIHDGHLPAPTGKLEQARLKALRDVLAQRHHGVPPSSGGVPE